MEKLTLNEKNFSGIVLTREQLKKCLGGVAEDTYVCGVECGSERAKYSSSSPCEIYTDYLPNGNSGNSEIEVKSIVVNGQIVNGCAHVVPIIFQG